MLLGLVRLFFILFVVGMAIYVGVTDITVRALVGLLLIVISFAVLLLTINLELYALLYILVYAGALVVFFLFIVLLIDLRYEFLQSSSKLFFITGFSYVLLAFPILWIIFSLLKNFYVRLEVYRGLHIHDNLLSLTSREQMLEVAERSRSIDPEGAADLVDSANFLFRWAHLTPTWLNSFNYEHFDIASLGFFTVTAYGFFLFFIAVVLLLVMVGSFWLIKEATNTNLSNK